MSSKFDRMLNNIKRQYNINVFNYSNYQVPQQDVESQDLLDLSLKTFLLELQNKSYEYNQFKNWLQRSLVKASPIQLMWAVLYFFFIEQYYCKNIQDYIELVKTYFSQRSLVDSEFLRQSINKISKLIKQGKNNNIEVYKKLYQDNITESGLVIDRLDADNLIK